MQSTNLDSIWQITCFAKRKKSENKGRNFRKCWKNFRCIRRRRLQLLIKKGDSKRYQQFLLCWIQFVIMVCFSNSHTYVNTLLQNTICDGSFQNFKFNYVERVKIAICNNVVIWINKVIGCVKRRFKDDEHKISHNKHMRFWTPGLWWKKYQRKIR